MVKENKDKLAVLVVSCDRYSDLWNPFFTCFKRFWPDCPFNVYLLSNKKTFHRGGITNITIGEDLSWSDSLIKGVKQLEENYVLLFLDDLFLHAPVNTKNVLEIINWALKSGVNYIRLKPMLNKPDRFFNEHIGIISKGVIYRTSTVMSVWKKEVLLDLLNEGESAWDFETYGSNRSSKYDDFYATWKDCFATTNTVIKGKWNRNAVRKFRSLGIEIDTKSREVMTPGETTVYYIKVLRSYALSLLPAGYRRKIKGLMQSNVYRIF